MNKTRNQLKMFSDITRHNHFLSVFLISLLLIAICLCICLSFPVYPSFEKRTEDFSEIDQKAVIDDLDSVSDIERFYIMSSRFRSADIIGYKISGTCYIDNKTVFLLIECLFDNDIIQMSGNAMTIDGHPVYKYKVSDSETGVTSITYELIHDMNHYLLQWTYNCSNLSETAISELNIKIDRLCCSIIHNLYSHIY